MKRSLQKQGVVIVKDIKIKFPVYYEKLTNQLFDSNNALVADIRGYGRLQEYGDPNKEQDKIGEFVANSMNKFNEKGE